MKVQAVNALKLAVPVILEKKGKGLAQGRTGGTGGNKNVEDMLPDSPKHGGNVFEQLKAAQEESADDIMKKFIAKQRKCKFASYVIWIDLCLRRIF
jgi:hypothetical protein